jgi:hypothetical protein
MNAITIRAKINELTAEYGASMAKHRAALAKVHAHPGDIHTNPEVAVAVTEYSKEMTPCRDVRRVCREIESLESIMDYLWGMPLSDCRQEGSNEQIAALTADDAMSTTAYGLGLQQSA